MINKKHKCVFVQVPKTASTSIRMLVGHPRHPHLNIQQLKMQFVQRTLRDMAASSDKAPEAAEKEFDAYFKFGFVRNPWDRVVSLYERKEGIQLRERMSFDEFVRWIKFSSDTCIHPALHRNQLDWFKDEKGRVIVDYIGRFENLEQDWLHISSKTGLPKVLPHQKRNGIDRKNYRSYYDQAAQQIIGETFGEDIEYFGYQFSG